MIILLSWVCFFKAFYFEVSIDSYGIIKIDVQYAMAHHPAPVPMSMYFTVNSVCACVCVWVGNIHIVSTGAHGSQKRLEPRRSWTTRCRSWALKPGPQQEQSILLSTEPSFQPPSIFKYLYSAFEGLWLCLLKNCGAQPTKFNSTLSHGAAWTECFLKILYIFLPLLT